MVKEKLLIKRLVVDEFEYEKHDVGFDYGLARARNREMWSRFGGVF